MNHQQVVFSTINHRESTSFNRSLSSHSLANRTGSACRSWHVLTFVFGFVAVVAAGACAASAASAAARAVPNADPLATAWLVACALSAPACVALVLLVVEVRDPHLRPKLSAAAVRTSRGAGRPVAGRAP